VFGARRLRLLLRARVVLFTSAAVVVALLLLGTALYQILARALYQEQRDVAINVVEQSRRVIAQRLGESTLAGNRAGTLEQAVSNLTAIQGTSQFRVVVIDRLGEAYPERDAHLRGSLPAALVEGVAQGRSPGLTYVKSPLPGSDHALIVGTPIAITGETYQGYFFFPLSFQERTLILLVRILVTVGLVLLATTIVLTAVLTGRVLEPIRRARDVAEQVADGDLSARIDEATSTDDFGRLAESFNRMTGALAQKITELEDLSSLQARFVSDVSHELRTPLATVRMAADYIHSARAGLPPDAQRAAVLLERELERFENLLEDLLEISRFDAGVVVLDAVEVDLAGLLDEVVDALDVLAHNREVSMSLEIDRAGGPPLVAADPRRLDRVFNNLVKNAIEHTSAGEVRIKVERDDPWVVVTIEDEGEGIPEEDLQHIFERFYRADVHRARTQGGTGLGLAIALENVNLHRGDIDVVSQVDKGSVFTVRLPAMERRDDAEPDEPAEPEAPGPKVPVHG
jgi:two-component system, OmpR family, sensor histidine kinase MtrB